MKHFEAWVSELPTLQICLAWQAAERCQSPRSTCLSLKLLFEFGVCAARSAGATRELRCLPQAWSRWKRRLRRRWSSALLSRSSWRMASLPSACAVALRVMPVSLAARSSSTPTVAGVLMVVVRSPARTLPRWTDPQPTFADRWQSAVVSSGMSARWFVQLSYAIGVAKPLSLFVETYGSEKTGLTVNDITSVLKHLGCLNVCLRQSKSRRSKVELRWVPAENPPVGSETAELWNESRVRRPHFSILRSSKIFQDILRYSKIF